MDGSSPDGQVPAGPPGINGLEPYASPMPVNGGPQGDGPALGRIPSIRTRLGEESHLPKPEPLRPPARRLNEAQKRGQRPEEGSWQKPKLPPPPNLGARRLCRTAWRGGTTGPPLGLSSHGHVIAGRVAVQRHNFAV